MGAPAAPSAVFRGDSRRRRAGTRAAKHKLSLWTAMTRLALLTRPGVACLRNARTAPLSPTHGDATGVAGDRVVAFRSKNHAVWFGLIFAGLYARSIAGQDQHPISTPWYDHKLAPGFAPRNKLRLRLGKKWKIFAEQSQVGRILGSWAVVRSSSSERSQIAQ